MNFRGGEGGNHFGKLADLEPDNFIHERSESGIGFAIEGDRYEAFDAKSASLAGEDKRQGTITRDDA
jgi:hypothetical protein